MTTTFAEVIANIKGQAGILKDREERAVELVVIIPMLRQLGWNTDNLSEVYPQKLLPGGGRAAGDGKVDYALQVDGKCRILIEVKRWSSELSVAHEEQLRAYSWKAKPLVAVLTNGRNWHFYRPPASSNTELREFLRFDIYAEPGQIDENFVKLLARDSSHSSVDKLAKDLRREHESKASVEKSIIQAIKALSDPDTLREIIAEKVEDDSRSRPSDDAIQRIMAEYRVEVQFIDPSELKGKGGKKPPSPKPVSYTFKVHGESSFNRVADANWNAILIHLCQKLMLRHPGIFRDTVLKEMPERFTTEYKIGYRRLGATDIYVKPGRGNATKSILPKLLTAFRYPADSVTVKSKEGAILYPESSIKSYP